MYDQNVNRLFDIFENDGIEIYVVGGAVRNQGLGLPVKDTDFAVSCVPEDTLAVLDKNAIQAVPTGLKHGTVTAVMGENHQYEITSFRKDIETDGRHAVTEFGGTIEDDARRRDFTINALYMDRFQNIIDPLYVIDDLEHRILRFVGNPTTRILEDYLRILRFFRFLAEYHLTPCPRTCSACTDLRDGLKQISAERIGSEMKRLLEGVRADEALQMLYEAKIAPYVLASLELQDYIRWQDYVRLNLLDKDWRVELVMITQDTPEEEWRLSKRDRKVIAMLRDARNWKVCDTELGERFGEYVGLWALHFIAFENNDEVTPEQEEAVKAGAKLVFPLNGDDLKRLGYQGKAIGRKLEDLRDLWREAKYTLDRDRLLASVKSLN